MNKHNLFHSRRSAAEISGLRGGRFPRFFVASKNRRVGFDFPVCLQTTLCQQFEALLLSKKKDCHLPCFSLILTPMAPCGARSELVSFHLSQVKNKQQTKLEEQMKFNKWTLGLAAVGAVSMASTVRADDAPKMSTLNTALSSTTISGYVDVGAQYNTGNSSPGVVPAGTAGSKVDNFSLNDVDIAFDKPEDESPWASGYHIDLNVGTDAVGVGGNGNGPSTASAGSAAFAIRQAYVVLRTPVGNGIDWKVGIQDDIIGYEGNTDGLNPNYTRSIGYAVEPTTLLGMIGSYKICDAVTVQAGVADATSPGAVSTSDKTFAAAIALTAPASWGWAKGATLNIGTLQNLEGSRSVGGVGGVQNYYVGLTLPTPSSALKIGASFDLLADNNQAGANAFPLNNAHNDSGWVGGLYGSFQATDKLAFNLRGEYYDLAGINNPYAGNGVGEEVTATIQYNLWANVISRAEFRWDHVDSGNAFGLSNTADSFVLAANLIYTF